MRCLSQIIFLLLIVTTAWSQSSPHGSDLQLECSVCHSTDNWDLSSSTTFDHNSTGFQLTGEHKNTECKMCHSTLVFSQAQNNCNSCHTDMHASTVGQDCDRCHNTSSWIVMDMRQRHLATRFPLEGVHTSVDCFDCHQSLASLRFDNLGTNCNNCHQSDYLATTNPNHLNANFSTECTECHNTNTADWKTYQFDHSFFPLTQGHNISECTACHANNQYTNTSNDCYTCHNSDYLATTNPSHVQGGFYTECLNCHTTTPNWQPAEFKEHDQLHFPIYTGKHNNTWDNCTECHTNASNFAENSCIACHEHNKTETDKVHSGVGGYNYASASCLVCHPNGSADEVFNHNLTNFPLVGEHQQVECLSCHTNGYQGTSTDCNSCHASDYLQTSNPPHVSLGISTACEECHTPSPDWKPATFAIHDQYYPLIGAHRQIASDCKLCHANGYTNTPTDCYSCHSTDYMATTNPSHSELSFSHDCETCHSVNAWSPSNFNHDSYYPLVGAHASIKDNCLACHANGYTNTPTDCYSCHSTDYLATTNPSHSELSFSQDCETCHSVNAWSPSNFNHDSYYPLVGAHASIKDNCLACHANGYTNTPTDCYSCHSTDYMATTNPSHSELSFSQDCETCHSVNAWSPSNFNHDSYYPLVGAHASIKDNCLACHANGYTNTPTDCYSCHSTDYMATTNPSHSELSFSQDCETCHSVNAWSPSNFNHDSYWVLTGAHKTIEKECLRCHSSGYTNTSNACYSCHASDYNSADNHLSDGFPKTCEDCHGTTSWGSTTFNHDSQYFPIYSGKHRGEWNKCTECHTQTGNFSTFSCIDCHEHNKSSMDSKHRGESGYVYNSNNCYACHPRGRAEDD